MDNGRLKVGVATSTRFHMFDLAHQMMQLEQETTLFTAYPRYKLDPELRQIARTRSPWLFALGLCRLLGLPEAGVGNRLFQDYSYWLARAVQDCDLDVLDVLDGLGLHAGRIVRDRGKIWVCNRGSSHVAAQQEILTSEYARWNVPLPADCFIPERVAQCLAEYEESTGIVVPSAFAKQTFVDRRISAAKVHVCPYGVDLSLFRPHRKEDEVFRVLFVGSLSIRKGIGYLLDAVEPLVSSGKVSVWCIGSIDPSARPILDRGSRWFTYKGVQPRNELAWFFSQGSVLVLPSIEEGLALVQAQAMACSVPVIATPNTGAEDLFTDGVEGFIIPAQSALAIRQRIQWLLDNRQRRDAMAAAALRRVTQIGGWRDYGGRCLEMYRNMAKPSVTQTVVA